MSDETAVIALAGTLGLLVGSFLNVCIVRWPAMESVVAPRSRCPQCGALIAWYDNIPVVSWLLLRGKCRGCALPIPIRYPMVELAVGVTWAVVAWQLGASVEAFRAAVFLTILIGIAMTDAREYIIPDEFSLGGTALGVAFAFVGGALPWKASIVGAVAGFGLLWVIGFAGRKMFGREAMGGGDIKMMAMVGAFTGGWGVLLTLMFGAVTGLVIHVLMLPFRKGGTTKPLPDGADVETMSSEDLSSHGYVPFGVSLAIAAAAVFIVGPEQVIEWYLAQVL